MAVKSLAVKYRPKTFDDVSEQSAIRTILENQLSTHEIKNAYLFCGGAGTGKTTCARIFAQEINNHQGSPVEMDAASNNSVDDVRDIIQQAKTKSLNSEYKVFIMDEVHALSNSAWQAMLKLIEEPPAKSIFIFCTTDPQKIPKTILSRVQRYDFQRISQIGIWARLDSILDREVAEGCKYTWTRDALDYIAKLADGGMRDAITLLDKCLALTDTITIESVITALGATDYDTMFNLTDYVIKGKSADVITVVESIHSSGKDLKQFIKTYMGFLLDVCKYDSTRSFNYLQIPQIYEERLNAYVKSDAVADCYTLLEKVIKLNTEIKWDTNPKALIESVLLLSSIK